MMVQRRARQSRSQTFRSEGLEPRGLMTAGLATGMNLVEYLGQVSPARAIQGVEVVAPIAAHSSLTFAFDAEVAGTYTLEVKYTGQGLALSADGSPSITPGPAGTTTTLELAIKAGLNTITASDLGGGKVVVDWELFLNNGVGQAVAPAPASTATPLPSTTIPVGTATVTPSPFGPSTVSSSMFGPAQMVGVAGPRLPLSPVSPIPNALAYDGEGVPQGSLPSPRSATSGGPAAVGPALALEIFGDIERDVEALTLPAWINRLASLQPPTTTTTTTTSDPAFGTGTAGSVEGEESADVALAEDSSGPNRETELASLASPAMLAGVAIAAVVGRRLRPGLTLLPKRRPANFPWSRCPSPN